MATRTRKTATPKVDTATLATTHYVVDVGNYNIKSLQTGNTSPLVIRSLVTDATNFRKQTGTANTPLMFIDGKSYHFGSKAYDYPDYQPIVLGDKTSPILFRNAVLATIQPETDNETIDVELSITLPNDFADKDALRESLLGTHQYRLNGLSAQVTIHSVNTHLEGEPAYLYAKSLNLVPDTGYTLLVDIGGGTWNVLVFNPSGDVIGQPMSIDQGGGIALARLIANDSQLIAKLRGDIADVALIQDGLTNSVHEYGETGISWEGTLDAHLNTWFRGGIDRTMSMVKPYLPKVKRILFTGGNAHLLREYIEKGKINAIIPTPELANVLGMFSLGVSR